MRKILYVLLPVAAALLAGCNHGSLQGPEGEAPGRISFYAGGPAVSAEVSTKASVVTATDLESNGFKVSCVAANEASPVWANTLFTKTGGNAYWNEDKWWPLVDGSYRFYAVYPTSYEMTHAAGGPTIAASNAHDIIAAYAASPTYKATNTLSFEHIFARLGSVTVSEVDGYTISGVTISIVPKVSGTYNLLSGAGQTDGTGWSATSDGAAATIANAVGANSNDIYLVPGTYTLTASWTATKGEYTQSFSGMTVDVALVGGKTNNITAGLTGDATEIRFDVSVTPWVSQSVDAGTFPVN